MNRPQQNTPRVNKAEFEAVFLQWYQKCYDRYYFHVDRKEKHAFERAAGDARTSLRRNDAFNNMTIKMPLKKRRAITDYILGTVDAFFLEEAKKEERKGYYPEFFNDIRDQSAAKLGVDLKDNLAQRVLKQDLFVTFERMFGVWQKEISYLFNQSIQDSKSPLAQAERIVSHRMKGLRNSKSTSHSDMKRRAHVVCTILDMAAKYIGADRLATAERTIPVIREACIKRLGLEQLEKEHKVAQGRKRAEENLLKQQQRGAGNYSCDWRLIP